MSGHVVQAQLNRRSFLRKAGLGVAAGGVLVSQPGMAAGAKPASTTIEGPLVFVPPPTGDAATDTANIQAAIASSPDDSAVLFSPTPVGTPYVIDQTIVLAEGRTYRGAERTATVIEAAPGSNLVAMFASDAWYNNATLAGDSFTFESLHLAGNDATNPGGGHGLVFCNFRATIRDVYMEGIPMSGVVLSDKTANGMVVNDSAIENHIEQVWIEACGQYGFWVLDTHLSGVCTDGYLQNCIGQNCGADAVRIERSAGWFINNNHVYGCATNGFVLDQFWGTFFSDNEVDGYGGNAVNGETYYGVKIVNVIAGRPGTIHNNQCSTQETAGSNFVYYFAHNAGGINGNLMMSHNSAHIDPPSVRSASSTAYWYEASTGNTLTVYGHGSDLSLGPRVALNVDGGGSVAFVDPVSPHAASHEEGGSDPVALADAGNLGFATTLHPSTVAGVGAIGASMGQFAMFESAGTETNQLRLAVGTSAGNISAAVYDPVNTGLNRVPGAQVATTGAIPCPATGIAYVTLDTAVTVAINQFGAVSADTGTAQVGRATPLRPAVAYGIGARQSGGHPLPAQAKTQQGTTFLPWISSA